MKGLTWLAWPVFCISIATGPAMGADEPASSGGPPPMAEQTAQDEAPPIDPKALDILKRMADTLSQAKGYGMTMRARYDVVQKTGEKIEFGEQRKVLLSRPNVLKVESQDSDGKRIQVTFDGKMLTVFTPDQNVYGQIEQPGTVDDAVHHLVQDLQVRLPMALLLVTTLPAELEQRLQALDYVERDVLGAVPTDHLAGRTGDVDFQAWIAADGPPLPQRITITYKTDEGEPQYRADFSDWTVDPDLSAAQVAFTPPNGAERIPFMIKVRRTASDQPPATGDGAQGTPGPSGSTGEVPK